MNAGTPSEALPALLAQASILLIDDDACNIRLLAEMLRDADYRLFAALGRREGFERAIQMPPALVLLDLYMPGMDGRETCRLFMPRRAWRAYRSST